MSPREVKRFEENGAGEMQLFVMYKHHNLGKLKGQMEGDPRREARRFTLHPLAWIECYGTMWLTLTRVLQLIPFMGDTLTIAYVKGGANGHWDAQTYLRGHVDYGLAGFPVSNKSRFLELPFLKGELKEEGRVQYEPLDVGSIVDYYPLWANGPRLQDAQQSVVRRSRHEGSSSSKGKSEGTPAYEYNYGQD